MTEALVGAGTGGMPRWLLLVGGLAVPIAAVVAWQQFSGAPEGQPLEPVAVETAVIVASVDIVPPSEVVEAGDTVRLTVTALDGVGASVSASAAEWRVDDPGIATVDQEGVLIAGLAGSVRVSAAIEGVEGFIDLVVARRPLPSSDTATVDGARGVVEVASAQDSAEAEVSRPAPTAAPPVIEPPAIASLSVTVSDATMAEGSSQLYLVELFDAQGVLLPLAGRTIALRSSSSSVLVEPPTGRITAREPGSAYLIATAGGVVDSVRVVVSAVVAGVVIQGGDQMLMVDASVTLRVEVRDARQRELSDRTVDWSSTDPAVLIVDQTGRVTATAPGSAEVVASSEGVEGRVTLVVEAAPPPAPVLPTPAEVSAEAERYVSLLNDNAQDEVRALFGTDADADGSDALLSRMAARDFNAALVNVGDATLDGEEASVRFQLRVTYRSNFGTGREGAGDILAVLTMTSDGWRIQRCSVAPGAEF